MSDVPEGYKMSEVGVVPEDWEVKELGGITKIFVGKDLKEENFSPYADNIFKYPVYSNTVDSEGLYGYYNIAEYQGDSLSVVGRGVGLGTAFKRNGGYGAIGRLLLLFPYININTKYLCEYINHKVKIFKESSGIPQLTGISLAKYKIPLPPTLEEQQAIASALSDVDALITAREQLIAKKRNIKQGAMQQLLTGEKRLLGFGGGWKVINIAENSVLKARIGWQGLTTAEYLKNGEYYLVTGTDFIEGKINWSGCHFIDENRYVQDKNIQLRNNDVLITKDGTIGKVGYVDNLPGKATLNSGVFVIRPRDKSYFPLFFYYVLKSNIFDTFMKQLRAGSTIPHLYQKDFVDFSFSVPSLPEQQAIAQILSDMDAEIEALKQKRDKYKAIKQGMMQELLTGKTRLV